MATPPTEQGSQTNKLAENTIDLSQLEERLLFSDREEKHRLKLKDPRRRLIHQGYLQCNYKKKHRVFLLDHALIITEPEVVEGWERLWVVYRPIPVTLLRVLLNQTRPKIFGYIPLPVGETRYQLCFSSPGKRFNNRKSLTLVSLSSKNANTWIETVHAQQATNQQNPDSNVLKLGEDILKGNGETKISCAALYNNAQTIVYGTVNGVYVQPQDGQSRKVINLRNLQQVDVLEESSLLIVLAERSVFTFPLDLLETGDPFKHMKRIAKEISFFKVGSCMDRTMVCMVKSNPTLSTVKILEPVESLGNSNPNQSGQTSWADEDQFRMFREFYLSQELHSAQFLKTKLCVAASSGFEIVDLENLDTHALLDPKDPNLKFVHSITLRALGIYRIGGEFLLCYKEFAFYASHTGNKSDKDMIIRWEGTPTACALHYPYIVAFSPEFVEIRHVDDGSLVQVIIENDVRCLYAKSSPAEDLAYHISRRRDNNLLVYFANKVMFLNSTSTQIY